MKTQINSYRLAVGVLAMGLGSQALAADQRMGTVLPQEMPSFSGGHPDVVPNSISGVNSIRFEFGCFAGGNMRNNSKIRISTANEHAQYVNEAWFKLVSGNESKVYKVLFPGNLVDGTNNTPKTCSFEAGGPDRGFGLALAVNKPSEKITCQNRSIDIRFTSEDFPGLSYKDTKIELLGFYARYNIVANGYSNAGPGKLTVQGPSVNWTDNAATIKASFAGLVRNGQTAGYQNGPGSDNLSACVGYYSPVMLFFDAKRPNFSGKSAFLKDSAGGQDTYWPEANAPGYFLALDSHGDQSITSAEQLFGQNSKSMDGYEAMKAIDSNGDGRLDAKDPAFAQLLLWRDRNGDGIAQPKEVERLSDRGVVSISVAPNYGFNQSFGGALSKAKAMGRSSFVFKNKKGKIQKGAAIDIWFAPAHVE